MSEQITHYTPCCATCRHAEAGGPCAWRHDNADGDCCPDWEYGNHAAWLGDDTPYPMASREITAEPHGSMEEHTALCEHTRVESLPDRRKQLPHHVMVLHSQKGLVAAAALAYRYGKELHPAGTAAKLQELAKESDEAEVVRSDRRRLLAENAELRQEAAENAADKKESLKCIRTLSESISRVRRGRIDYDRVRAEVQECAPLSDDEIDALLAHIAFWRMGTDQRNLISDRSSTLTAFDPGIRSYQLTARGREVLAAIEACRVTEAEPEPEPEQEPTLTESADGRREWRLNGVRHREDGPAIEGPNGYREWLLHGKLHREDGPAIEWPDGRREWWLHGKRQPEPDKGGRQ